jgi:hypothetical protein
MANSVWEDDAVGEDWGKGEGEEGGVSGTEEGWLRGLRWDREVYKYFHKASEI